MNIGTPELILAGVILLFLFGGSKLPELSKGIAEAIKEIKKSLKS
ncbi:MAG: Sec-independent protein translocase protein TatA [Candidatus Shapirobacteria bacterium GW2011_GWE1_38_92]|uniref:Sec-independent protein translocase protein TatA n=2 Tax=Candidatus Shapironibacteriota TaxID=1752721 RepID=A0A0G0JIU4_9BACT|nr:MAG: Sec-independent protein translocase protein TatA [Candidatus Shapirobacteria bacterium GW2011_GWE2_38_30]KKQ89793.1 MAG: Sec-independent protein translocase protein TatA [Candidatus Shapirobacteria bacterium GW2011_GWE1_38_92]HAP37723.1 twin-arginine translocase TatA/TatE family subunit [Candidatus Shapirobacteria bacterium]HCU55577.1 twin-arginine translocase TatA/TatE family subunit [Candidatus Shapirobacteria bacterium]